MAITYDDFILNLRKFCDGKEFSEVTLSYYFAKEVEKGKETYHNADLEHYKAQERYNRFTKFLADDKKCRPEQYLMKDFNEDETNNIYSVALAIIKKILGNGTRIDDLFNEFISLVILNNSQEVLDGGVYRTGTFDKLDGYVVFLPSNTNISAIVCIVHEFMHFFLRKNNLESCKFYYGEILSIMMEKISSAIVQNMGIDSQMINKIENVRIETLKYHYTEQKDYLKFVSKFASRFPIYEYEYAKKMCNDYRSYYQLLAQCYGIGYLYAENLYSLYQESPQKIITDVRNIIDGSKSLEDVLSYYNIGTDNKNTFEIAKNKIKLMTNK